MAFTAKLLQIRFNVMSLFIEFSIVFFPCESFDVTLLDVNTRVDSNIV